nr:MAG TPA: hypothetical protein [Caudoviricetes sp.]
MKIKTNAAFVYDGVFVPAGVEIDVPDDFVKAQNELLVAFNMQPHEILAETDDEQEQPTKSVTKQSKPKAENKEADDL